MARSRGTWNLSVLFGDWGAATTLQALTLACGSSTISIPVPEGVEIGIVAAMSGSVVATAGGLSELSEPFELVSFDEHWISVSAWTRSELGRAAELVGDPRAVIQTEGCEPRLPRPSTHFAFSLDGEPMQRPAPVFGHPGLDSFCELDWTVEVRCNGSPSACVPHVRGEGCRRELDLRGCLLGESSIAASSSGEVCFRPTPSCVDGPSGTLTCRPAEGDTCSVVLHRVAPPAFELVERVMLDPSAASPAGPIEQLPSRDWFNSGSLRDLAVSESVLLVSVADVQVKGVSCAGLSGRLIGLDSDTLDPLFERRGECVDRIVPRRGGFVTATWRTGSAVAHARALDGTISSTVAELVVADAREHRRGDIAVDGARFAMATSFDAGGVEHVELLRTELDGHELPRRMRLEKRVVRGLDFAGDRIIAADDRADAVLWIEDSTLAIATELFLQPAHGSRDTSTVVSAGSRVVALSEADLPSVHVVLPNEDLVGLWPFEVAADATSAAWVDERVILGAASRFGLERRGFVLELDVEAEELLPGAIDVGVGPVTRVSPDGRGGAFAMLPWEGAVARVRWSSH